MWIYLVGLAQIAVIILSFSLLRTYVLESPWKATMLQRTHYLVSKVAERRGDPAALNHEARRIKDELGATLALYAADGTLLTANSDPPLAPLSAEAREQLRTQRALTLGPTPITAVAVLDHGVMVAYGLFAQPPPPLPISHTALSIGIAIICLSVGSALFARALARPLSRLAEVARGFGAGDLTRRARFLQRDEIGELGKAFDEMADRVTGLLRSRRSFWPTSLTSCARRCHASAWPWILPPKATPPWPGRSWQRSPRTWASWSVWWTTC